MMLFEKVQTRQGDDSVAEEELTSQKSQLGAAGAGKNEKSSNVANDMSNPPVFDKPHF